MPRRPSEGVGRRPRDLGYLASVCVRASTACLVGGALFLGGATEVRARPNVDAADLARLTRYDVLAYAAPGGGGIEKSKAIGVFDATPDEVMRTATDYDRLSEFAPRVVSSQVVDRPSDTHAFVMLSSDLPWPVSHAWVYCEFTEEQLGDEVYRVRFAQVRGSMRRYFGSILIEPFATQKSTVTYEFLAEPTGYAPRGMLNRKLRDAASHYVHALRQRVNDLHRLGRLHPKQPPLPDLPSTLAGSPKPVVVESVAQRR